MRFEKYHGLGNDFIFLRDCKEKLLPQGGELAKRLCHRNFGIGADGLVLITGGPALYTMRIFNPDGSEAEMCGNAIRCLAAYLVKHDLAAGPRLSIGTIGGIKEIKIAGDQYVVDMGEPDFTFGQGKAAELEAGGKSWTVYPISLGNPHGVTFPDDLDGLDIAAWGPLLENHEIWPKQANIEFVKVKGPHQLQVKVWERGAGPTLACGTGACAALVVAAKLGLTERSAKVSLPGGDLFIEWNQANRVLMSGPAEFVYAGEIEI